MDLMTWLRNQWDRAGAAVAIFLGMLALVIGWVGVSGTGLTPEQIPYVISGGIGGLFLLGLGAMLWLSADMRDEWRAINDLRQAIDRSAVSREFEDGSEPDGGRERDVLDRRASRSDDMIASSPVAEPVHTGNGQEPRRRPLRTNR